MHFLFSCLSFRVSQNRCANTIICTHARQYILLPAPFLNHILYNEDKMEHLYSRSAIYTIPRHSRVPRLQRALGLTLNPNPNPNPTPTPNPNLTLT